MQEAYRQYLASDQWKDKAKEVREYYHYKCAVCDLDYQKKHLPIQVHHMFYSKNHQSIIGKEHPYFHLRLLCTAHHPQGKLSNESIQLWRKSYKFQKRWSIVFNVLKKFWRRERTP